eukprot:1366439-Amorphochlora_amoeboformis.AAC.2
MTRTLWYPDASDPQASRGDPVYIASTQGVSAVGRLGDEKVWTESVPHEKTERGETQFYPVRWWS